MFPEPMSAPVGADAKGKRPDRQTVQNMRPISLSQPAAPSAAEAPELHAPLSTDALNALHDFSTFHGSKGQSSLIQPTSGVPQLPAGQMQQVASPPQAPQVAPAIFMSPHSDGQAEVRNVHMIPSSAPRASAKPSLDYLSPTSSGNMTPSLGMTLSGPSASEKLPLRPASVLAPVNEQKLPAPLNTGLADPEAMGISPADIKAVAPPVSAPAGGLPNVIPRSASVSSPVTSSLAVPVSTPASSYNPKGHPVLQPINTRVVSIPEQSAVPSASSQSRVTENSKNEMCTTSDPQFKWSLGDYLLGKTLGAGSMGKVKLGISRREGEKVAVKIVPRNTSVAALRAHIARAQQSGATEVIAAAQSENSMARAVAKDKSKEVRIVREGSLQMLLRHPYICGMHEMIVHANHYYMVFEYINGGQMLDYIISHGRLRERSARSFARQIGSALQYCHANNVVHRDLKIENILISKSGNIKIIDFGLSNLYSPQSQLNTFCGSLYFAAPELLNARPYRGPEVDIWSFGIVLYVLVCGKVPFDDQSMPALHAKIKRGHVEYPAWLSTECKHLLSRMLVTNPFTRATLTEVLSHPWMTRGYDGPPDSYLPNRVPLRSGALDEDVIQRMTGFDFGSPEDIRHRLESILQSNEYKTVCEQWQNGVVPAPRAEIAPLPTPDTDSAVLKVARRLSGIDFYRKKMHHKEPEAPSTLPPLPQDPTQGYHPLISIYYLVAERRDRERVYGKSSFASSDVSLHKERQEKPIPQMPQVSTSDGQKVASMHPMPTSADIPRDSPRLPEETHMSPRATEVTLPVTLPAPPRVARLSTLPEAPTPVFESRQKSQPLGNMTGPPRARAQPDELESSLRTMNAETERRRSKMLPVMPGVPDTHARPRRSISLHDPQHNQRAPRAGILAQRPILEEEGTTSPTSMLSPPQSSPRSASIPMPEDEGKRILGWRNIGEKSLSSAVQSPTFDAAEERPVTSMSLSPADERADDMSGDSKPVFLKGLFSVQTTSTRPRTVIRADLVRVLNQMGVQHREIKGGFECTYKPSVAGTRTESPLPKSHADNAMTGDLEDDDDMAIARSMSQPTEDIHNTRPAHSDVPSLMIEPSERAATGIGEVGISSGSSAVPPSPQPEGSGVLPELGVHFEVFVVKVPFLFGFNGLQFRRVSGNPWQYQMLARCILQELKL